MGKLDNILQKTERKIFRRALSQEEKNDIYELIDALNMEDDDSFLHILLINKVNEINIKENNKIYENTTKNLVENFSEASKQLIDEVREAAKNVKNKPITSTSSLYIATIVGYMLGAWTILIIGSSHVTALPAFWGGVSVTAMITVLLSIMRDFKKEKEEAEERERLSERNIGFIGNYRIF